MAIQTSAKYVFVYYILENTKVQNGFKACVDPLAPLTNGVRPSWESHCSPTSHDRKLDGGRDEEQLMRNDQDQEEEEEEKE